MPVDLTPRMSNWIRELGVHIATASKDGFPTVIVAIPDQVEGNVIRVPLKPAQIKQIEKNIAENPYVAAAPAQLGAVRAPYQIKGPAKLSAETLEISVEEIYCTKPGDEAGIRLDILGFESMKDFDESRWQDLTPPGK